MVRTLENCNFLVRTKLGYLRQVHLVLLLNKQFVP